MPEPKHETIALPTLPHSGLCDAPRGGLCTCAAGLLRLIGGGK